MKLSKMNTNELRDFVSRFGEDKKRLYGTSKDTIRLIASDINRKLPKNWCVVRNGEIQFRGTEMECAFEVWMDRSGELEMYSDDSMART